MMIRNFTFLSLLLISLFQAPLARSAVLISEFMASNTKGLTDEDGDFSDWIEIRNTGSTAFNLDNWFLTDDATQLLKWRFPSTNVPPNGQLLVFASNKDRRKPGAPLHTNFRLSNTGEFLALVAADGKTIESSFAPAYPPQADDVSFGIDTGLRPVSLIKSNAAARVLIPTDDALGTNWILKGFSDAAWRAGALPVGFAIGALDAIPQDGLLSGLGGYWKLDETSGVDVHDSSPSGKHGTTLGVVASVNPWTNGFVGNSIRFRGTGQRAAIRVPDYTKPTAAFSASAWVWADARTAYASILKNGNTNNGQFHFGLRDTVGDLEVIINTGSGRFTVREGSPLSTSQWHHVAFVADGTALKLFRDGRLIGSQPYSGTFIQGSSDVMSIGAKLNDAGTSVDTSAAGGVWNGRIDEVAVWTRGLNVEEIATVYQAGLGFGGTPIQTDVSADLFGQRSSVFLRVPFVVSNPQELVNWRLAIRYDDGAKIWINGNEVLARNVPDPLAWNGVASERRPTAESRSGELLDLNPYREVFQAGENVLAVQLVNSAVSDHDLLMDLSLEAFSTVNTTNQWAFFVSPTPGAENRYGNTTLGPIISEVSHFPAVPNDDQDLVVSARITPTLNPIGVVQLRYRAMYTNEVTVLMTDNGLQGDLRAGDSIYTATIPASVASAGQMIRYAIVAFDNASRTNRLPLFKDRVRNEEYFGTVVANPAIVTALPVMQWFVKSPAAAEGNPGTQCSIFYNGEFYDNARVRIRGGTSLSWPKHSYKVELPEEHEFRIHPGVARVTEFDWNTTYTDKSYVRAQLVSEHQLDAGMPSPEIFPVRLEQNGKFYSVALFTEQPDAAFLRRHGLDDQGSLYKGGPGSNAESDASFEKKTRDWEDKSDLKAFLKGLSLKGTALENFVFDNIDLPAQINYMATVAVVQNIDGSDKNFFLYRDTEGNGEWRMLPWDLDLSFGPDALNTDAIVFDSSSASHPFIGARPYVLSDGKYNTILEAVVNTPRSRQMLIRRIRTLVDRFLAQPYFQNRIEELYTVLTPDVALDKAKWKADAFFPGNTYTLRQALDRIENEYLKPRVPYLTGFRIPGILSTNVGSQPYAPKVGFGAMLITPPSGDPQEEYVQVVNQSSYPVDISGWKVAGDIEFTFKPGTVLPTNGIVWLSPKVSKFRARAQSPRGGEALFVQGDYRGQLSALGGTLVLRTETGWELTRTNFVGQPSSAQQAIQVTEPLPTPVALSGDAFPAEDYEFIELWNSSGSKPASLADARFTRGITFAFSGANAVVLQPNERLILARNPAAFSSRYPGVTSRILGPFLGLLENGKENLRLEDSVAEVVFDFKFDVDWYPMVRAHGFSLVRKDENAIGVDLSAAASWRTSSRLGGSPGVVDLPPPEIDRVVISEILSAPAAGGPDKIELFNAGTTPAALGGWFLTDDFRQPKKYRFPANTTLAAGGYLVLDQSVFNAQGTGFQLGSDGDEVWLFSADPVTGALTGYFDGFAFGAVNTGATLGRWSDSLGRPHLVVQSQPTLGSANREPVVGPIVLSEFMSQPMSSWAGASEALEYVEVWNRGEGPVSFKGGAGDQRQWALAGDVKFELPLSLTLPAKSGALIVGFDPFQEPAALSAFRTLYGIGSEVPILGPWRGELGNGSGLIVLRQPLQNPSTNAVHTEVDRVEYQPEAGFVGADGDGTSWQRRLGGLSFGDDPASWTAARPSPGRVSNETQGLAPQLTLSPVSQTVIAFQPVELTAKASGTGPLSFQWHRNEEPLPGETNATLRLNPVLPSQFGNYRVTVFNAFGSDRSTNAVLQLRLPAFITQQPLDSISRLGTNVTFSVRAVGTGPLRYQWRFGGVALPGAQGTNLVLSSVRIDQAGLYDVEVTDDVGPMLSRAASLIVVAPPKVLQQPDSTVLLLGETLRLFVEAEGTPPLTYRWRRGSTLINGQTNPPLTINNVGLSNGGNYNVIVANGAGSVTSQVAVVTVLVDGDKDGMADVWETANGFDPTSAADAILDTDGDGVNNRDEYLAGTDPKDATSYLRFEQTALSQEGEQVGVIISWQAMSNHTYAVWAGSEATDGPTAWQKRWQFGASPTNTVLSLTNPIGSPSAEYYRLQTPRYP